MANRQRAEARRKAAAKANRQTGEGSKTWLWLTLGIVAVIAIVIVAITLGGDDDDAGTSSDTVTTDSEASSIPDSQPVTITGDPLPAFEQPDGDPAVGMDAPLLSGLDFQSDPVVIDPAAEGPYMLVFMAHWCPHCNAEIPVLIDWKNSGGVPAELNVIGVATAPSPASANYPPHEWFANKGWRWPILVDESQGDGAAGRVAQAYGATGWPYFVIVGADGKVKVRVSGEVEVNDLQQIVDDALTG